MPLIRRMQGFGTTIFAEMSALAASTGSINLGQGFPDTDGPSEIVEAAIEAVRQGANQYPPGDGIHPLRAAIADHQRRFWDLSYNPDGEVLVTAGATEGIAASVLALCEPGDEVVTFEPYYDSYAATIALAGATRRVVTLRPPDFSFAESDVTSVVTDRTRLLLLNSPHNPTGKVFSRAELAAVARICLEHDLIAVTDEVYEHIVFDGEHVPLATLPGMRDRTITISSGAKTFSFTGWKVGWVCAPRHLIDAVRTVKQFLTYVNAAPLQPAIATGLALDDGYFEGLAASLARKRDRLCAGLDDAGFTVYRPAGSYFVTAGIDAFGEDSMGFCRELPARCGVVAIPTSVFYDDKAVGDGLVRFAFCKRDEVIDEAVRRLKRLSAEG